jgi:hypothetical protein
LGGLSKFHWVLLCARLAGLLRLSDHVVGVNAVLLREPELRQLHRVDEGVHLSDAVELRRFRLSELFRQRQRRVWVDLDIVDSVA